MGLPIERWAREATLLEPPPPRIANDLNDLLTYQRSQWPRMLKELRHGGDPQALESTFGGMVTVPNVVDGAAATGSVSEIELWGAGNTARHAPIPANTAMGGEVFRLSAHGTGTTSTSPGTWVLTPRLGTTTSGGTLGASAAVTLTASITGFLWYILGDMTVRTIGSGTSATAIGMFHLISAPLAAGSQPVTATGSQIFGNTQATFDSTAAQGLFMGSTAGATTVSFTLRQLHWMSWN